MTNFNGINPWLNMLRHLNNTVTQNQNNGVNNETQDISQNIQQTIANLSTNVFAKDAKNYLNALEQNQALSKDILKMDNEIVQKYLQTLLDMPESIDIIFEKINPKNSKSYQFLKIFVENMLNNKELSQLLKQNSNDAIQKLLNVITQSMRQGHDTSQLKEILSVLNTIHTTSLINTNTLRELFLLYIPINYQVFKEDSDFSKITSENEDKIKESTLSILFETVNFSNILATLEEDSGKIIIQLYSSSDFPCNEFQKIISIYSKENSINAICDFVKIKEIGDKGAKQNFKIISKNLVSINVLNISNVIIKTIFKLDNI